MPPCLPLAVLVFILLALALPLTAAAQEFIRTGTYIGDDSMDRPITGIGFQPDLVIVKAVTNKHCMARTSDMPSGLSKKLGDNIALESDRIQTLDPDGFTIGSHNDVNDTGIEYHWVAMKAVSGTIEIGHYTGDGAYTRTVPVTGMLPDALMIMAGESDFPVFRHTDMAFWEAYRLDGGGEEFNSIGYFNTNEFYVGDSHTVNENGKDYYYVAWKGAPETIEFGFYFGNGLATQDITGLGMDPEYLFLANASDGNPYVHRTRNLTGDATLFFLNREILADHIQAMWDGGFQVGSDSSVNRLGTGYFWLAFANPPGLPTADLQVSMAFDDLTPIEDQTLNYSVDVVNAGPDEATGVQISYQLPPGLTLMVPNPEQGSYDDVTGIWDIGTMTSGQSLYLSISATVDAGTGGSTLTNIAGVTALDQDDPDLSNNSVSVDLSVLAALGADLAVTMTVDEPNPSENQTVQYTVTLTNNGPDATTGVVLDTSLPSDLSITGATPSVGSYGAGTQVWDVGPLASGESQTLTIDARVHNNTAGQTISSGATVTASDVADPNSGNNTASADIVVLPVDLQVTKLVNLTTPGENSRVTYTIIVTNLQAGTATGVEITDLLPLGLTFVSASTTTGSYDDGTGIWTVGDLASAQTEALNINADIDPGTGGLTIINTATVTSLDQIDVNPLNNTHSVGFLVPMPGGVDLNLSKVVDNGAPSLGETVLYTVTLSNPGLDQGTGIEVTDILPAGVSFVSAMTNKGSYDDATGLWTVGDLDAGYQAVLNISALVEPGALGAPVTNIASVTAADQTDPDPTNNTANAEFTVPSSDLQMSKTVNNGTPLVGDTVTYTIKVFNDGPNQATAIQVTDLLPAGLTFVSASADQGTYDEVTGVWIAGNLNPALDATLTLETTVDLEAAGSIVTNNAFVTASDQADPDTGNNSALADITVPGADLELDLISDTMVAVAGSEVTFTLSLQNNGPDDATGVRATQLVPAGLSFISAVPSQGSYNQISGVWTLGGLTNGAGATLDITVLVDQGTDGTVIASTAAIGSSDLADPDPANNTDSASITVPVEIPTESNFLWPLVGASVEVLPGETQQADVLTFAFVNSGSQPDTLQTMVLSNLTAGSGTPDQMDAEWQPLTATYYLGELSTETEILPTVSTSLADGLASFNNLQWAIPAGDTLTVTVQGGASLEARDGALLQAGIAAVEDLVFAQEYSLIGTWPLVSGQSLDVNGFVAAQAAVVPLESSLLSIGSEQNLALTVDLPGNGFLDDALYSISLKNSGSAEPGSDITRIQVWADGGNGTFDLASGDDTLLGPATYSGELWQLTGLNVFIPAVGRRFYATVDIAETAQPARDIRLSLPAGNGHAVEMFSGNDGPVDMPLENPNTLGISLTDRIILTGEWFLTGVALPGANDTPLSQFVVTNTYTVPHQLQSLTFTNTSEADGANNFQRDALCRQVDLRLDANNNGELDDLATDPALASGFVFFDNRVIFSGLELDLLPDTSTRLFVTADLGLMTVADGNRIKGQIESISDVGIPEATIVSSWPLHSGVDWLINGMTAQQISTRDITVLTLGPGEGPILAMDLTIPANGYATDELSGISFANEGSAGGSDIVLAQIWEDGGNGTFDEGDGDDLLLGPLTLDSEIWTSNVLARPIPTDGLQVFTSLTVADTPRDSVTVKLGVPTGGITVSSGNDGPLDEAVSGSGTLVISTSPLRTSVSFASAATDTGQTGTINMALRNAGSETMTGIDPDLMFATGDGLLVYGDPVPESITSLDPGEETMIVWPYRSTYPGEVILEGNAQGLVNGDQVRRSIVTPTAVHRIFTPVPRLELYPTANLPFSINRGQQGLVPLTLTFVNPGDQDVADAQLTSIRLSLLETEDGPGIVPADLLDRVIVSEGTNVYLSTTTLPTSGNEIDLVLSHPVVITGSEPVTLGLRLDLRLDSTVPSFLISIEDASWLVGNDAINGADLAIVAGEGDYPVRTGQANLVAPAAGLDVAVNLLEPGYTVPGQTDILLTEISLFQSDSDDNSSTIDVGRLAFEFHGPDGQPLIDPARWISGLSLQSAFQEHFSGVPVVESDSLVVLQLSAPVTISGSANIVLHLVGDIAEDSPLGGITAVLGPTEYFDARDGNMNNPVSVTLTTDPSGPEIMVLSPATVMYLSGNGAMPIQVSQGTRDLTALNLTVSNPGGPQTSPASGDTLVLAFFNAARQPLAPGPYLDHIRVQQGEQTLGLVIDPVAPDGVVTLPLSGLQIEAGHSAELQVSLDLRPDAPTGTIEVVVGDGSLRASDTITGSLLPVQSAPGTSFPFSSGVGVIVVPADELTVSATSLMPPMLAPQADGYPVLSLEITNPAGPGSGGIELNSLTVEQEDPPVAGPGLGQMLTSVNLLIGEDIVATATGLEATATTVTLVPENPLIIAADQTLELLIEVILAENTPSGVLELGLHTRGVEAGPPGGEGVTIRVLPVSGETFPFITEKGNIGGASLAESYINFPNPFAAGRESTTFAFNLPREGRVSLRLVTPHGELVAQLIQNESRPAGFYQSDLWSGLNGNGVAVRNGVYLAELVVEFSDGSRERILRKVAVVR